MAKGTGPTNPNTKNIIKKLKKQSNDKKVSIWKDIAKRLESPKRIQPAVNISKLERYLNKGDSAIIPGKVLGDGNITKAITVSALKFSKTARSKIQKAGGKCVTYEEMITKNPKGSKIKIMS
ncbi:MAG: 50S ribosomal protein L18e [archaeon]